MPHFQVTTPQQSSQAPPTKPFEGASPSEVKALCQQLVSNGGYLMAWEWKPSQKKKGKWEKVPVVGWKGTAGTGQKLPATPDDIDIERGIFPAWAPGMSGCVVLDVDSNVELCLDFFESIPRERGQTTYYQIRSAGGRGYHLIFRNEENRFRDTADWGIRPPAKNGEVIRYDLRYAAIGSVEALQRIVEAVACASSLQTVPKGVLVRMNPVEERKTKKQSAHAHSYSEFEPLKEIDGHCLVCDPKLEGNGTRFELHHTNKKSGWTGPWCWNCLGASGTPYHGRYAKWLLKLRYEGIAQGFMEPWVDKGLPPDYDSLHLGQAFLKHHDGNIIYDPTVRGGWRYFDNGTWATKVGEKPLSSWIYTNLVDEVLLLTQKGKSRHRRVQRAREHIKELNTDSKPWDQKNGVVGIPGGKVWTPEEGLTQGRKNDYVSKFVETAPAATWRSTRWESFLNEVAGEASGFLRRAMGYALLGNPVEHVFLTLVGPGGNGKSIFQEIVHKAAGDYATTASMEHFLAGSSDHPQHVARLRGARFVFGSEAKASGAWKSAMLKSLTGGDTIEARFMRQDSFEFKPQCLLVMAVNSLPQINEVDDAIRRRMRVVPFDFKPEPEEIDKNLYATLLAELDHVVRWLLDGAEEYIRDGMKTPPPVRDATRKYLIEQDTPARFLETCERRGPDHRVKRKPVRDAYIAFCKEEGLKPLSAQKLCKALRSAGIEETKSGTRFWLGIEPPEIDENGLIFPENKENQQDLGTLGTLGTNSSKSPPARAHTHMGGLNQTKCPSAQSAQTSSVTLTPRDTISRDDPRLKPGPNQDRATVIAYLKQTANKKGNAK